MSTRSKRLVKRTQILWAVALLCAADAAPRAADVLPPRLDLTAHPYVSALGLAGDRVLVAGDFEWVAGEQLPGLVRLLPDGSVDASFRAECPRLNGRSRCFYDMFDVAADGSVYAVGDAPYANSLNLVISRLTASGQLHPGWDASEALGAYAGFVRRVFVRGDSVYLVGLLLRDSAPYSLAIRLDSATGALDPDYVIPPGSGSIYDSEVSADGSLFTIVDFDAGSRRLLKYDAQGAPAAGFSPTPITAIAPSLELAEAIDAVIIHTPEDIAIATIDATTGAERSDWRPEIYRAYSVAVDATSAYFCAATKTYGVLAVVRVPFADDEAREILDTDASCGNSRLVAMPPGALLAENDFGHALRRAVSPTTSADFGPTMRRSAVMHDILVDGNDLYVSGDHAFVGGNARSGVVRLRAGTIDTSWNISTPYSRGKLYRHGPWLYADDSITYPYTLRSRLMRFDVASAQHDAWDVGPVVSFSGQVRGLVASNDGVRFFGFLEGTTVCGKGAHPVGVWVSHEIPCTSASTFQPNGYFTSVVDGGPSWLYGLGNAVGIPPRLRRLDATTGAESPGWGPAPDTLRPSALEFDGQWIWVDDTVPASHTELRRVHASDGGIDASWSSVLRVADIESIRVRGDSLFVVARANWLDQPQIVRVDRATGALDSSWNLQSDASRFASVEPIDADSVAIVGDFTVVNGQPRVGFVVYGGAGLLLRDSFE